MEEAQQTAIVNGSGEAPAAAISNLPGAGNEVSPNTPTANEPQSPGEPAETATTAQLKDDWHIREKALLDKIASLEKVKNDASTEGVRLQLKVKEDENEVLKDRIKSLETELAAALARPGGKNQELVENIKRQHEELLSKARGMIFDKTKMVKNQELQIEALASQVESLKDVASITKDLLEIRNTEVKHLEARLEAMEAKFAAEKERHFLMMKKVDSGTKMNEDLKKEYETQLGLFKELRVKYEERVQALVAENLKLTELQAQPQPPAE